MAKFKPMELIDVMRGKFSSKSKYYAAEKYGTQYTGKIGEITVAPTEAQLAQRERFVQTKSNIAQLTEEQLTAYKEAFRKQTQYRSLQGYIFAMEYAKIGE
jgi:dTDP-4-amino-4,6-dideoxygalactose transaminase